jgi:hypothetical protein
VVVRCEERDLGKGKTVPVSVCVCVCVCVWGGQGW